MSDFQTTQSIGMNVLCQTQLAQVSFRIKSHNAHFSKQPSHAFGANQEIQTKKFALASLAQIISRGYYFFLRASVSPIVLRPSCKNRLQPPNGQSSRITPSRGWLLLRREPSLKRFLFLPIATSVSSWRSFVGGHQIAWPVRSAFLLP